jgi:hypothetical protein
LLLRSHLKLQELPKRTLAPSSFRTLDGHPVVLYGSDEPALIKHVAAWLSEHLAREYPVLVVATPSHRRAFGAALRSVGIDTGAVRRAGLFNCLDATAVMNTMAADGEISWRTFDRNAGELVRNLRMRGPLRVYGEIVNLMWMSGDRKAAIELEMLWNRLRARVDFELLCAYGIDAHGSDFAIGAAEGIIRTHTSVVPYGSGDSSH